MIVLSRRTQTYLVALFGAVSMLASGCVGISLGSGAGASIGEQAMTDPAPPKPVEQADPATYLADLRAELVKKWPQNRPIYVVAHGHSVPAGYFWTPDVKPFESYPHLLHRRISAAYPTSTTNVIVTAIGGEQAESGAARFQRDVLDKRPDVVLIDYALNDRGIGLERARAAWSSMIEAARAAEVPVILLTPTPDITANRSDPADPLNQHAAQIRELAAEYGVALVDSHAAFDRLIASGEGLNAYMSQGNHPNGKGHTVVAEELKLWFGIE